MQAGSSSSPFNCPKTLHHVNHCTTQSPENTQPCSTQVQTHRLAECLPHGVGHARLRLPHRRGPVVQRIRAAQEARHNAVQRGWQRRAEVAADEGLKGGGRRAGSGWLAAAAAAAAAAMKPRAVSGDGHQ